jgi:hypothetical protein
LEQEFVNKAIKEADIFHFYAKTLTPELLERFTSGWNEVKDAEFDPYFNFIYSLQCSAPGSFTQLIHC